MMIGQHDGQAIGLQLFQDKNHDGVLSGNEIIASSFKPNTANQQLQKSLKAGTYFVRVVGINGETNYHLTLHA
jgi:hypothetical protein